MFPIRIFNLKGEYIKNNKCPLIIRNRKLFCPVSMLRLYFKNSTLYSLKIQILKFKLQPGAQKTTER